MKKVTVNPLDSRFTNNMKEALTQGYTIVCSQRPLNGLKTWENETVGHGIYFAYGDLNTFQSNWEFLDAAIVEIQTNQDVISIIETICIEEGTTLSEVLEDSTLQELAESLELVYIPVEEDATSLHYKELYNAIQSNTVQEVASQQPSNSPVVDQESISNLPEANTYYFYNQTFNTYLEAYNHALNNDSPVTMVLPANHPTMTNERLKQLEHDYTFNLYKMDYRDMKEYYDYISTLTVSSDQQERIYKLRDSIQRHEYKQQQEQNKRLELKNQSDQIGKMLNDLYSIGMIKKENEYFVRYYLDGQLIYSWYGGITTEKMYYELLEVYNVHYRQLAII